MSAKDEWNDPDITTAPDWWRRLGFAAEPRFEKGPQGGLLVYHVSSARERLVVRGKPRKGSGRWYTPVAPTSVMDAEMRLNIALWGNLMRFVTPFRIPYNVPFLIGPAYHGEGDLSRVTTQIYVSARFLAHVRPAGDARVLRPDATMVSRIGHA